MSDLISRQDAIDAVEALAYHADKYVMDSDVHEVHGFRTGLAVAERQLSLVPSAQPERKKGEWIPTQNPQWKAYYHDQCSVCGWWNTKNAVCRDSKKKAHSLNFCPNCGAKMLKEGEEHETD